MKELIILTAAMVLLCGCTSNLKQEDVTRIATIASEHTLKRSHRLFADNYEIEGVVVKVEDHPADMLRSAMNYDVTYHIEYKQVLITGNTMRPITNSYVLPITQTSNSSTMRRFKVGDKVSVTGWIEKGR